MLQRDVAPGIHFVEDGYTNWYIVEQDAELTLVDAGHPTSWDPLQEALRAIGRRLDDVRAVVLTHGHFDHMGFAERARRELGVPVWVHENDVPLTRHPLQFAHERSPLSYFLTKPKALPVLGTYLRKRAFWPPPIGEVVRYADGTLDVPGSPEVVFTPGHTLGHCALHLPERDTLLAGDAVVTFNPYTGGEGPQLVARAATADVERALAALDQVAATGAKTVLTGHGPPWYDGAEAIVARAREVGAP